MAVPRKNNTKRVIQEGIEEYNSNRKRKSGITMEELKKNGIELSPKQNTLFKGIRTNTLSIVHGPAGTAKAQPLDSLILTPQGWVTMGDIKVGDLVFSVDGTPTEVTGVFPQGEKDIWELTFTDGVTVECCPEHLWFTWMNQQKGEGSVKSTFEIIDTLNDGEGVPNHMIPMTWPVEFGHRETTVDPYQLGEALCKLDGMYIIRAGLDLLDLNIPDEYKYNSVDNRVSLLKGLLSNGNPFLTTDKRLAKDVAEIVYSLGGVVEYINIDVERHFVMVISVDIEGFSTGDQVIERKIVSVRPVGRKPAKCISVSHGSQLYLTDGCVVTHNTFISCYTALYLLANKEVERIILTKPIKESGEELGFLPGTVAEKVEPFMKSYISNFEKIIGPQATSFLLSTGEITVEPLAYMRGSTYDWSVMLLDEAQNSTLTQLMLWSTRLGKESRMVLMGDTSQYDVREKDSGLKSFINMTYGMDGLLNFEFNNGDIVRNKFLIELTNRYDMYRSNK